MTLPVKGHVLLCPNPLSVSVPNRGNERLRLFRARIGNRPLICFWEAILICFRIRGSIACFEKFNDLAGLFSGEVGAKAHVLDGHVPLSITVTIGRGALWQRVQFSAQSWAPPLGGGGAKMFA